MVTKGSVALDGVSLTLVDVEDGRFSVALIPHTLAHTTLGFKRPGDPVNLETDLLAKYVQKCLAGKKNLTAENAECAEGNTMQLPIRLGVRLREAIMKEELNKLTETIIGAAIAVHRELGPGLLESAYEACLAFELADCGLTVEKQKELPVRYRGVLVECGYRLDLLVEGKVIVELKAVEKVLPIHEAQFLSYLKLSGCKVGLLLNFNVRMLREGLKRLVHELPE